MSRTRRMGALCAVLIAAGIGLPASAAQAAGPGPGQAPVTHDDQVRVARDGVGEADVLLNDYDPDDTTGTDLAICRIEVPTQGLAAVVQDDYFFDGQESHSGSTLQVLPLDVRPGTYQITYYACDYATLTPATLTVTVTRADKVVAHKTARPGIIRFRNDGTTPVTIVYGARRARRPDGHFTLRSDQARNVRVHHHTIEYTAIQHRDYPSFTEPAFITHIRLPVHRHPARSLATPKDLRTWDRLRATASGRSAVPVTTSRRAAPRSARTGPTPDAPRTQGDHVRIEQGSGGVFDVVANDTDPGGDDLAVCRVALPRHSPLVAAPSYGVEQPFAGSSTTTADAGVSGLEISVPPDIAVGDYQLTYYACDHHHLTPGTVKVTVTRSHPVVAHTLAHRPGVVRFRNPGKHAVQVLYFDPTPSGDGRKRHFRLGAHRTRDVRVTTHLIEWFAVARNGPYSSGTVRHIRQP